MPILLALALAAAAPEPEATILWRDLSSGDTPEQVAVKLGAYAEVKRAKVRRKRDGETSIDITYRGGGIPILGMTFLLVPTFGPAGLDRVGLATAPSCANDADKQSADITRILTEKYPEPIHHAAAFTPAEVASAYHRGTDDNPASLTAFRTDGSVVVMHSLRFTAEPPPPAGYTSSGAAGTMLAILWNQYEARRRECDGTGDHRYSQVIVYLTRDAFDQAAAAVQSGAEAEATEARKSL